MKKKRKQKIKIMNNLIMKLVKNKPFNIVRI